MFFFIAVVASFGTFAASFTATLDRQTISMGETAMLTMQFEGGEPKSIPPIPPIANLQIAGRGTSHSMSIINGQVTSTRAETFEVAATQPGEYLIPALQAEVAGQLLSSQPLTLTVVKPGSSATDSTGDQLAILKVFVPKKEVFVGEAFTVELQVYIREGVVNAGNIMQGFDNYGGPPIKAEGFSILKTAHAQRRRARLGNANYFVASLVTSVAAVKTGPLNIGSTDFNLPLELPSANQNARDPFDVFFGRQAVERRNIPVTAEPQSITVLPWPTQNIPPGFNGAVGTYSLSATAGPTNVAAGDPVTLKIQISGHGVLDSLTLPEQPAWQDFKVYPATAKPMDSADPLGIQGTKSFEQVIVPQNTDIKQVPPFSFSFFDPEQKSYRTLTQPAIPLTVRPGGSIPAPSVAIAKTASDTPPPAQDIVPIKTQFGSFAQLSPALVQQPWFIALQAVPILAWLSVLIWRRRIDKLANSPRLRRKRQVAQLVESGLGDLRRFAAENKSDEFFATLFRLLQEQLGERLDVPANAITEAVIEEQLRPRDVPESLTNPLHELFQICNLARYAPIKSSQELAAVIPKAENMLRELKELKL
jgi:hypothetical protein